MELAQIATFLVVSSTLACTPGADWAYIISSVLKKERYAPAVWGLLSGYLVHTLLLVCGIAALVASSPILLTWLTTAGALYLLWLGISTIRGWKAAVFYNQDSADLDVNTNSEDRVPAVPSMANTATGTLTLAPAAKTAESSSAKFLKGLLTSGTNPKALLLYVALIPQFLDAGSPVPMVLQTTIFGLGHFLVSILVYFAVAKAAQLLLGSRPTAARIVTLCSGIIMIAISALLLCEQFVVV